MNPITDPRLRSALQAAGLTRLQDWAARAGVPWSTFKRYRAKRRAPQHVLRRLADALHVDVQTATALMATPAWTPRRRAA